MFKIDAFGYVNCRKKFDKVNMSWLKFKSREGPDKTQGKIITYIIKETPNSSNLRVRLNKIKLIACTVKRDIVSNTGRG